MESRRDHFTLFLAISFGIHATLVLFVSLKAVFFPSQQIRYVPSVRVDLVALPEKHMPEPHATRATPKPKTPKVALKKSSSPKESLKSSQKDAFAKLKAMDAINSIKNELESKEKARKEMKPQEFKGNILSSGTQLTGLNRIEHEDYIEQLDVHVKKVWVLPQWLAQANYSAQALVKIDNRGYVIFKQIRVSSNNPTYDDLVLETIQKASPFPPPPTKFRTIMEMDGFLLGFPE